MTQALVPARPDISSIQDTNSVKALGFADFGPDDIDAILAADETCFPSVYYQLSTARIPMPAAEFAATFGAGTLSLFGTNQLLGNTGVRTNVAMGTSLNCCFWLRDVRFVLIPEAETWALGGASIATPAAPAHEQPAFAGTFPLGGVLTPAQLEYGKASQIAARKLRESFDLQFAIGCEFVLINTSLARVSCTQFEASSLGFGSPNTAMADKIRVTNDRARTNARGVTFLPQNSTGAEVSGGPTGPGGLGGPQQDCDDGWMCVRGGKGIMLGPNQTFMAQLVRTIGSEDYFTQFQAEMTDSSASGVTPDINLTDAVAGLAGSHAGVVVFKFANLLWGLELRGCKVRPACAMDWARKCGTGLGAPFFDNGTAWREIARDAEMGDFASVLGKRKNKAYKGLGEAIIDNPLQLGEAAE